jgi:RNA polymerase sigma-70 factor (ECF subfamily)
LPQRGQLQALFCASWGNFAVVSRHYQGQIVAIETYTSPFPEMAAALPLVARFNLQLVRKRGPFMESLDTTPVLSDRALVEKARTGDTDAFGELVRRHYRKCVDLATFIVRNHWDAEDQVQVAFSKAHARLDQYHGEAEFSTWVSRIVNNECLMFIREKRRAQFLYLDDNSREPDAPPLELPACGPDPEGELAVGELKQALQREIRCVPPLLRNVIMLRDIQELPMVEVAQALHISVPAAKSRLLRARTELRARLRQRCDKMGTLPPLSRSAAPLNRVAHRRAIQPLMAAGA